ncbi:MAG: acetyl-CoA carboxylase biotin carboxyl carrier protein [Clostridiales bacterium]|jgi:acetyl-CoA carboxylase biotin carboxyl carrier protein|nr:acetyl-CoA carboxylase biotin carboxyl carrier protein [Clostridiales bacterium]
MDINTKLINTLAKILIDQGLSELEIEQEGFRVRLSKESAKHFLGTSTMIPNMSSSVDALALSNVKTDSVESGKENTINAKMVGVFYISSSPDSPPFVQIGQKIAKGDVICILEAMKTMNEIVTDIDGEITEILVANGQLVEFGQPLFKIK